MTSSSMRILTFDIEDWFHILDNQSTKNESDWQKFTPRIHANMDTIFEILDITNTKATFFVLGWIAEQHPDVVKKIVQAGHEIGSHSTFHQLVFEQTQLDFRNDLQRSIRTLEDITGKKVQMYRAPGFSITQSCNWAFEELIREGITIDSSIFPAKRGHGGYPEYGENTPSIIEFEGSILKEFPINTIKFANRNIIFSGGGYFRLAPYTMINRWSNSSPYIMTYFHPRDFDPNQPVLKGLPLHRRFKSYVGLKSCRAKLEKWIQDEQFMSIHEADQLIEWDNAKRITLK